MADAVNEGRGTLGKEEAEAGVGEAVLDEAPMVGAEAEAR
jgi:hypothetical protein